jgi:osmotically-inducible protein OsmY
MTTSTRNAEHLVIPASEQLEQNLAARVEQALWADSRLRSSDTLVRVSATRDGAVTLEGHVRGDILRYLCGRLAAQVPGVRAVTNRVVADTDLENDVAMALALDPGVQTFTDQLVVKVILGVAQLTGVIAAADLSAAEAARAQAERVARAVPGVRQVVNNARAVVGTAAAAADSTTDAVAAGGDSADEAAMQTRLAIWKERAQAKQG